MSLQEARDVLFQFLTELECDGGDHQLIEALEFAVDRFDREIASYRNCVR